jgi:phosphopantetheinyl transferase
MSQSIDEASLASELLSSIERQSWSELPEAKRRSALLRTWVIKESLFKALGIGIAGNLPRIECLSQCDREMQDIAVEDALYSLAASDAYWPLQDEQRANSWRVRSFKLAMEFNLAVAYPPHIDTIQLVSWDDAMIRDLQSP